MKHSDTETAPEKLRCDVCGRFVSPFGDDGAIRLLVTPDGPTGTDKTTGVAAVSGSRQCLPLLFGFDQS